MRTGLLGEIPDNRENNWEFFKNRLGLKKRAAIEVFAQELTAKFPSIQKREFLHGYLGLKGARIYVDGNSESRNPQPGKPKSCVRNRFMDYVSPWERLGDAIERVVSEAGVSEHEAQTYLCQALVDRAVRFQGKLLKHAKNHFTDREILQGQAFQIPPHLGPQDFDWEKSRPVKPWTVRRGSHPLHGPWELEWVEVWRDDVTKVLCPPAQVVVQSGLLLSGKNSAKKRSAPSFENAKRAINKLYPEGVPDQSAILNQTLCQQVVEQLKKDGQREVSDDTILRAAGRRRN